MVPHDRKETNADGGAESRGRKDAGRCRCAAENWFKAYAIATAAVIAWLIAGSGCAATGVKAGAEIQARGAGSADSVTITR